MANTSTVRTLEIAVEGTFGSRDPATNLPAATAFGSSVTIAPERASLAIPGELAATPRDEGRDGYYLRPSEPATVLDGTGALVHRRAGAFSFAMVVDLGGDFAGAGGGYDGAAIAMLLAAGMQDGSSPVLAADYANVVSLASTANSFIGTGTGIFQIGDVIAADLEGRREYAIVTDVTVLANDEVFFTPAFSRPITNVSADVIRTCRTFSQSKNAVGSSVAFALNGDGWRTECYGCRWESLGVQVANQLATFTWTFQCALIQDNHAAAAMVDPVRPRGQAVHSIPANSVLSVAVPQPNDAAPTSAPFKLARAVDLDLESLEFTISNTLTPVGRGGDIYAMSEWEVTDQVVEVALTLSAPSTALADDFRDSVQRTLILAYGPNGAGNGMALVLPSAVLQSDPNLYDLSTNLVQQRLVYGQGRWAGDQFPGGSIASNTPVRIGLAH